ncbi:MAG: helix-turn-helix domain-containing protein [Porcipelethomonas sp.]
MISENGKVKILEKYIDRERTVIAYTEEINFYTLVKQGRTDEIKKILKKNPFYENKDKPLSDSPLQSMKYHVVITASMLARFCIEGGMEHHRAYEISDYYIRKADKMPDEDAIVNLHTQMCIEYSEQMNKLHKKKIYSKPIVKSIDYIYAHLHCRITVSEVAEYVGINENYFSRLFGTEIGISPSRYILIRKIEAAQNLLKNSDYSCSEISELLSFSSQSHFIFKFRKECGITPLQYRNKYYNHTGLNE